MNFELQLRLESLVGVLEQVFIDEVLSVMPPAQIVDDFMAPYPTLLDDTTPSVIDHLSSI